MDIVIVLDGSNSIYPWGPMTLFLQNLIPALDIGPQSTQVTPCFISFNRKLKQEMKQEIIFGLVAVFLFCQVSVIQYAVDSKFEFTLNQYKTKDEVIAAASRITQMFGHSTNTFHAIQYARLVLPFMCLSMCTFMYLFTLCLVACLFVVLVCTYFNYLIRTE